MTDSGVEQRGRSALGTVAVVAAVVSAIGLVVMIGGSVLDVEGFSSDTDDNATAANLAWGAFSLGAIVALGTGIATWISGSRQSRHEDVRAGQLAIGYLVVAVVLTAIAAALQD